LEPAVDLKIVFLALILIACRSPERGIRALVDDPNCVCTCTEAGVADAAPDAPPDAAPDAAPDAPPDAHAPLSLTDPWTRTTITAGAPTGLYRGADGVALDSEGCYVTAWEEGGIVTRACPSGAGWTTEMVASGLIGAEDAKAADLDADGTLDVVTCSDSGARCYITFRGAPNVTTTLTASVGHGHAMQAAIADINGDGLPDIVYGTRVGTPAEVAWLENPGATARTGAAWARHFISPAGWVMSLVVVGGRVVVSDRASYKDAGGVTRWDMYGARWLELVAGSWVNHPIGLPAGSCPALPAACTKTPGDEMFLTVAGDTVYDCTSTNAQLDSRVVIHRTTDWLTWTHEALPAMPNVGHCQGVIPADVDHDGRTDLIVTTWKGNAYPVTGAAAGQSGVYLLHATATGWERGEISGPAGGKFDNGLLRGDCAVTTEQLDPAGGLGVVMFCPGSP
jgi:VCBS repeat protein